jgi:hypothetical protein
MGTCFILRRRHLGVSQVFPHVADSLSVQHIAVVRAMQREQVAQSRSCHPPVLSRR